MKRLAVLVSTLALCVGATGLSRSAVPSGDETTAFTVSGRTIMLAVGKHAAKPFFIKGVDYAPTPICSTYLAPLSDTNATVWERDLPLLRKLGANAVKVYNLDLSHPSDGVWKVASIKRWLKAAYHGGDHPIYTIVAITIPAYIVNSAAGKHPQTGALRSLRHQYYTIARVLGTDPDIMGISIGGEWNQHPFIHNSKTWTVGLDPIINAAYQGLKSVGAQKILTTSLVDDFGAGAHATMQEGENNNFPTGGGADKHLQFAWGFDEYRGSQFGTLWSTVESMTSHPFIVGEWGEPNGFHPHPNASPGVVEEWPIAGPNPLPAYIHGLAQSLYAHAASNPSPEPNAVGSGGFVFEWSDEWWKASTTACTHRAGPPVNSPNANSNFPSGFDDEAWFGLNAATSPSPAPSGSPGPNVLTQRANYVELQQVWAPKH